jgi:hypothetical protein
MKTMSFEPVLNELSLETPAASIAEARQRMSRFIAMFVTATGSYKLERTLRVKDEHINYLQLAPDYPLARWRNDPQVAREERNFFRILETKHPYLVEHADHADAALTMECLWNDKPAVGFQAAFLLDSIAFSVPSDSVWDTSRVEVSVRELDAEGNWLPAHIEAVAHASIRRHLRELAVWIQQRQQAEIDQKLKKVQTGTELWNQRSTLFPSLEFCAVVQEQLQEHAPQPDHIKAVRLRLLYLEQYSQQWRAGGFDEKQLAGNASPESDATLDHPEYGPKRVFQCPDGQEQMFSWHLKMGSWRLHFYPDEERKFIIVGYIGPHLPTVKYHD